MSVPRRCRCGHHKAMHWRYGQVEGCGHQHGWQRRCDCRGYRPISESLEGQLTELFEHVAVCEHDWALMDRIDMSLGVARRRPELAARRAAPG